VVVELIGAAGDVAAWGGMTRRYLGEVPTCSRCGAQITGSRALGTFFVCSRTWCASCSTRFNPAEGTPICSTSWSPVEYSEQILLLAIGASVAQLEAHLGKSAGTIREMIDRVQLLHPEGVQALVLSGPVSSGIKRGTQRRGRVSNLTDERIIENG
jgi:transposase-like protein